MNIILGNLYSYPKIGGVENSLLFIAKELIKKEHNVIIFSLDRDDKNVFDNYNGISFYKSKFKNSRFPNIRYSRITTCTEKELNHLIPNFKPDEIWLRNPAMTLGCINAGFKGRVVQIYSTVSHLNASGICSTNPHFPLKKRIIFKIIWPLWFYTLYSIEKNILNKSDGFVFSKMMKQEFKKIHGKKAKKLQIVNPGVDIELFSTCNKQCNNNKIDINYNINHKKYILYVGRINTAKNISILIQSLNYINQDIELLLVGDGEDKLFLEKYVQKLGLNSRVFFLGKQNESLPAIYANAIVVVLPSLIESFGQTYIEALACGTPIIGFGNNYIFKTATDEVIKDGYNGKIVKYYHRKSLAEAINYFITLDKEQYKIISHNCIEDARNRYSWSKMVSIILHNIK